MYKTESVWEQGDDNILTYKRLNNGRLEETA
jgi:hypothetical protein